MPYYTTYQSPLYGAVSLEDLLAGKDCGKLLRSNEANTRTYNCSEQTASKIYRSSHIVKMKAAFRDFVQQYDELYNIDRHSLYRTFYIPKRTGGKREINAPEPALMNALIVLRSIMENECHALYHTSAFAYVRNRMTVDAVKKHQQNNSNWFLKVDFHDFFGSTTKEFVLRMLSEITPFDRILRLDPPQYPFTKALDLCFLDNKLPQGTPISPMLTNLIMIPIDHQLSKALREMDCVYTRYADDILISSLQGFDPKKVQNVIREVLKSFDAPYTFKEEKTRYGSKEGSNWNLGVMLNKDNNITVGHRNKKTFRAMLTNYILDNKTGKPWSLEDVQYMNGLLSYYKMVEPDYFSELLKKVGEKNKVDIEKMIKKDLKI